jgi:hypothetical protein
MVDPAGDIQSSNPAGTPSSSSGPSLTPADVQQLCVTLQALQQQQATLQQQVTLLAQSSQGHSSAAAIPSFSDPDNLAWRLKLSQR